MDACMHPGTDPRSSNQGPATLVPGLAPSFSCLHRYLRVDGRIPKPSRPRTSAFIQYTHDISQAMHKAMSIKS